MLADWLEKQLAKRSPTVIPGEPSPDLEIITCHNSPMESVLERTARASGAGPVTVLGKGIQDWNIFLRHEITLEHLKKQKHRLCLILDAFDVLLLSPISDLLCAYQALGSPPVIFNGERRAMPDLSSFQHLKEESPTLQRARQAVEWERMQKAGPALHLNAGCLMGERKAIIELLQEALKLRDSMDATYRKLLGKSDQNIMRILHHEQHPMVQVDTHERLFQCLQGLRGPGEMRFQPSPGPLRFLWLLLIHPHTWSYPYWKLRRSVAALRGRIPKT